MNSKFHTITIRIPSEQVYRNPRTKAVTLIPTLTKTNVITKRLGIPGIILKKDSHILHPEIDNAGDVGNFKTMKEEHNEYKSINKKIGKDLKKMIKK